MSLKVLDTLNLHDKIGESLKGVDFLSLYDFTPEQITRLLETAHWLKGEGREKARTALAGKTLGMVFTKASTRTRVSFEVGMYQLGGYPLFLGAQDLQLRRGEPISDTARVLSRYLDAIMIRTYAHSDVIELAEYSSVPVINGLTDLLHPCQVLADLLTIWEYKQRFQGLKLGYIGDGNNMANSLLIGCTKMGIDICIACPPNYGPDEMVLGWAQQTAQQTGARIEITNDPLQAADGADVLYTDVWASMGQEQEAEERAAAFQGFQVNSSILDAAQKDVIVLHCLPAHRGEEITDEVIEGPHSVVFDEAENRLHAQKAILLHLLS